MMDSFLNNKTEGREQVEVDDLKRDLSSEFTTVPDSQHSCIEEREHLQVYLRIRPFTSAESNNGESQDCVTIESPDTVLLKPPSLSLSARLSTDRSLPQTGQRFQFSQVYGPETTQRELFEGTVKDLVKDVLEGRNSLVFTYGVTNAGKTFTFLGPDADAGILPRTLDVIFSSIDEQVFPEMSIKPHRCREFTRLTREQQNEEALFKRNLFRQLKEVTGSTSAGSDKISLEVETNTKFSIWVSFCEIYNENIHDLLEVVSSGAPRRTALRLSQDVKGNAFVKDLRWVQINSAEEAYRVMKLGKKNQSFSSTRLNHLSSRSHSIFSIRILRIEDIGTLRVQTVSELCLCDLAGSERCAKTQNKGDRLKEAGNINTSLLTLGKCINALRHNQQAKLLQHVPFRESKLTHYLQGFFCGRGKACMIVNINQCASMYDETLNVLKFSAVAQKVVVLSSRPLPIMPQRSASEVSFIINDAERRTLRGSRRSSLIGWESSLEDVQEDEDDESLMDDTMDQTGNEEDGDENDDKIVICKKMHQRQAALLKQLQIQLKKERAESLLMEAQVREEISREFSELFSEMQSDYDDRLAREREILEEQAERRLEIFKNMIDKMAKDGPSQDAQAMVTQPFFSLDHKPCINCFVYLLGHSAQASVQLQTAQAQLDDHSKEIQEKSSQIHTLTEEVQRLKQELQTSKESSDGVNNQLREEASELRKALTEEKEKNDSKQSQILELDSQLSHIKQQLAEKRLISDQQLEEFTEKLNQKEAASNRQVEELRKKLQQQEETSRQPLEELRSHLESQQQAAKEEIEQLKAKLEQQTEASEKQVEQLNEKLREQEVLSLQQLAGIKQKLGEDKTASDKLLDDVKQKLTEQEKTAELLKAELEEAKFKCPTSNSEAEEDHKRWNSDLQTEVASLKVKISNMEETKESSSKAKAQIPSSETEQMLKEKDTQMEEKLAELEKASAQKEAELQDQLLEKEAEVTSLKKSLQEAQERREEEECQAVQEARRREVERRRELLAVAHEAIAQKDAELEKKAEEISRLKEEARQDLEKVKSLGLDLQRKEDDSSDLREKLADYKKQIQQVQKEISTMREEEKSLKQKLADSEKAKKHLQSDLTNRDRTIQQLKAECDPVPLHVFVLQRVMEDMRLALMEQEETQEQMEQVLEEKLNLIQELSDDIVKRMNSLKWLEEKLSLIGQAKEAEDKRNQEMRKFAEDRERYTRQHNQLESQLTEKDQTMEKWRKERDTLVAALEIQLQKLLSSQAEKDKLIKELQQNIPQPPLEVSDAGSSLAELKAALSEREAEILRLKKDLQASTAKQEDTVTPVSSSTGCPSVLDSSEISTENGRTSRFPRPELEISFSPLQPNRMALRRQGEESAVTVKITRSARKRKSSEMEKVRNNKTREEVEAENRRNTRTKLTPKLTPHKEESSIRSRKEGTLQKIGDFLQSSPTLLGSKAKKMMSLVSGRVDADSAASTSSLGLRAKKNKRKLYRPEISSPMDMPSHPIISREPEEEESDHQVIKRRLRSRMAK
uniref:Kinesin family member 20Ba n=1 Tax=Amphiprion percula TaxID=161767 RepID=A0A3P8T3E0_AMPPE